MKNHNNTEDCYKIKGYPADYKLRKPNTAVYNAMIEAEGYHDSEMLQTQRAGSNQIYQGSSTFTKEQYEGLKNFRMSISFIRLWSYPGLLYGQIQRITYMLNHILSKTWIQNSYYGLEIDKHVDKPQKRWIDESQSYALPKFAWARGRSKKRPYLFQTTLHDMFDIMEENTEQIPQHPSRTYIRDTKARRATPADVIEYPNAYQFLVDMPGLKPDNVKVHLEDENVLVVSGERKREKEKEEKEGIKYLRMERRFGKFLKKFVLPENANTDAISANFQDRVLLVNVEKRPPPEPKKPKVIEVKLGGESSTTSGVQGIITEGGGGHEQVQDGSSEVKTTDQVAAL